MPDFRINLAVRDYECDLQEVVNNSTYFNYLEHARHEYLHYIGVNFTEMHNKGFDLVVTRAEADYKYPLTSGDKFYITVRMEQESRIRFAFYQDIHRASDDKLIMQAKIVGTSLDAKTGRPCLPEELKTAFAKTTSGQES
ncbi:MAG: thioesterase family protein [Candidatus Margulisiibacteriota bacterium]